MLCISTSFWVLKCFSVNFSIILLNWQAPIARGENDFFGKYVTELTRPHLGGTTRQRLNTGPPSCATPQQPTMHVLCTEDQSSIQKPTMA